MRNESKKIEYARGFSHLWAIITLIVLGFHHFFPLSWLGICLVVAFVCTACLCLTWIILIIFNEIVEVTKKVADLIKSSKK